LGRTYNDFQSDLKTATTSEERVKLAIQGLASNKFVRNIEALDRSDLDQIKKTDPDLFAMLEPDEVREALVLTGFFRYSLSKGMPGQGEIELEDMPSCSRRDFITFTGIFTSREDALPPEDWSSGPDAVKIALKSIITLHSELKTRIDEVGEGAQQQLPLLKLNAKQLRALTNVLDYSDSYLMEDRSQISSLLGAKL